MLQAQNSGKGEAPELGLLRGTPMSLSTQNTSVGNARFPPITGLFKSFYLSRLIFYWHGKGKRNLLTLNNGKLVIVKNLPHCNVLDFINKEDKMFKSILTQ